jgi:hypothetical protein
MVESQRNSALPIGLGLVCEFFIENIRSQTVGIS